MTIPIEGFEKYLISEDGSVINSETGRILKQSADNRGYLHVILRTGEKQYTRNVHRLVAQAFIPNPDNLPIINHIDGNKQNNSIVNLEWCTQMHNVTHAALVLRTMTQYQEYNKKHQKKVQGTFSDGTKTEVFESVGAAARAFNTNKSNIFHVLSGKCKTSCGLTWRWQ